MDPNLSVVSLLAIVFGIIVVLQAIAICMDVNRDFNLVIVSIPKQAHDRSTKSEQVGPKAWIFILVLRRGAVYSSTTIATAANISTSTRSTMGDLCLLSLGLWLLVLRASPQGTVEALLEPAKELVVEILVSHMHDWHERHRPLRRGWPGGDVVSEKEAASVLPQALA